MLRRDLMKLLVLAPLVPKREVLAPAAPVKALVLGPKQLTLAELPPPTRKVWSRSLWEEARRQTYVPDLLAPRTGTR